MIGGGQAVIETVDLRKDNLYAIAGYNDDCYTLNIQNMTYKLNEEQFLMIHNMITNTLQYKFID